MRSNSGSLRDDAPLANDGQPVADGAPQNKNNESFAKGAAAPLERRFVGRSAWLGLKIAIWAAILLFFAYLSYLNLQRLDQTKAVQAGVQREIDAENEKTAALQAELAYQESDAYYEKVAREQLGLVKSDEIIFIPR
jgi:cell division protein FtsB